MKRYLSLAAALLAFTTLSPAQTTAVPGFISYQGRVVDSSGNNVGTGTPVNRTVIFRIWNSPSSTNEANLVYSEMQTVTIAEGEFSVLVGQGVANSTRTFGYDEAGKKLADLANAFSGSNSYLGVTVAAATTIATTDNEIAPRQQIVSTAFALRSKVAETVLTGAIETGNLANNSITSAKLAPDSVNSNTIQNGSIMLVDLANNSVDSSKIVDGSIATADLANGSVTLAKLALNSVDGSKIANGAVTNAKLANNSVNSSKIADFSISTQHLASGSVTTSALGVGSVTTNRLADGSVTASKLSSSIGTWGASGTTRHTSGSVGIGTTNPTRAKLEVVGKVGTDILTGYYHSNNPSLFFGARLGFGIFTDNDIAASVFLAFSDERIKRIEGRSDGARDLESLLEIEVTDYSFIDTISKGSGTQKKVIAQQVEEVFPQAVSQHTDVVPDIYQKASIKDGWVGLATDLKKGERVRLIAEADEGIHEVLEVAEGRFRTAFVPTGDQIFVYGREVSDFRTVDYEAIAMLNVSATQALKQEKDAEVTSLQGEVSALKNENKALRDMLAAQDQRLTAMEAADRASAAKLVAIEKLLQGSDTPDLRTVSITSAE